MASNFRIFVVPVLIVIVIGAVLFVFSSSGEGEDRSAQIALNGLFAVLGALIASVTRDSARE